MTEERFTHDCFKCKYSKWDYHYEVPIVKYLYCKKDHEKTSYNTPFGEDFVCEDYKHSYFVQEYIGIWIYILWFGFFILALLVVYLK